MKKYIDNEVLLQAINDTAADILVETHKVSNINLEQNMLKLAHWVVNRMIINLDTNLKLPKKTKKIKL